MITPDRALALIIENTKTLNSETAEISSSVDRVLAKDVTARINLPPFNNSAMDGYAVRCEDLKGASRTNPKTLLVHHIVRAGYCGSSSLKTGEAIKIMTGAPIPEGADAVVMKELTSETLEGKVQIFQEAKFGQNIRPEGEDKKKGDLILRKGTYLRPYEISLLASQGIQKIESVRSPRVAVIATGDELVNLNETLAQGKIYNSNGVSLITALNRWGCTPKDYGIVGDNPNALRKILKEASLQCDIILVSGGVSVGDYDYTRSLLLELGVKEIFWKVAIKPGKPLFFGVWSSEDFDSDRIVFGLPGNPVSALVCLEEFVRPALEKMKGYTPQHPSYHLCGKAENDYPKPDDRQQYIFCQVSSTTDGYRITIIRPQGAAMMGMSCQANGLAIVPIGTKNIKAGDTLSFRWLK